MHIKTIELQNFKTIEDFKAEFSGGIYLITGENEVGKSTLLGAIATLLDGERTSNLLQIGKEKGFAKATIGDQNNSFDVELRFTEANPRGTLKIVDSNGMSSTNKSMLQQVFQYQDFDANEFVNWSSTAEGRRKQVELVMSLLQEKVQAKIQEIDQRLETLREERKEVNIALKQAEVMAEKTSIDPEDVTKYKDDIDIRDLYDQKTNASAHNERVKQGNTRKAEIEKQLVSHPKETKTREQQYNNSIQSLKKQLEELETAKAGYIESRGKELEELQKSHVVAVKWVKENKLIDTDELEEKINEADYHNTKHKQVTEYLEASDNLGKIKEKKQNYESEINSMVKERAKTIEKSNLPVDGLSFTEEGLFLNGVPFSPGEVSTSQEMEVAAKLIIAKNPKVKVFRIAQGESLGNARMKAIVEFAKKNGYQGFIEEVHRGQQDLRIEEYTEKYVDGGDLPFDNTKSPNK
jgi:predicted ATP-dependent endonuclease of OLD family